MVQQRIPAVRRGSQTEFPDHAVAEPTALQIIQGGGAGRREEGFMEKTGCLPVGAEQTLPLGPAALVILVLNHLRHGHMRALRQQLNGLRKGEPLHFHDKGKDGSAGLATETVIKLHFRIH